MNPTKYIFNLKFPLWLNKQWFSKIEIDPNSHFRKGTTRDFLKMYLYRDLFYTSIPSLLRYGDRHSMSYSIENRVPFLTPELVSFLFSLPEAYIVSNEAVTKNIFRSAMKDILPDTIRKRKDKLGAPTPEKKWMLNESFLLNRIIKSDILKEIPAFNTIELIKDWNQFYKGKSKFDFRFWRWINFVLWAEKFDVKFG